MNNTIIVGKPEIRKDSRDKVSGAAQYAADISVENVNWMAVCRSSHHHARILKIDTDAARKMPGVLAVLTAADVPGAKAHGGLVQDQPVLACDRTRHLGEPLALVVAENRSAAEAACQKIKVEYEPLKAVFDPVEALQPGAPLLHEGGNLIAGYDVSCGDVESGFKEADVVVEENFAVARVAPAYMEPENSLAVWHADGSLTVWVSSQHPFIDHKEVAEVLALPLEKVQVKSAVIGGAFGGRECSTMAILAALGAWAVKGKVRVVNRRKDSFLGHPKRHAARIYLKAGAKKDGRLVSLYGRVYLDTGAFASLGPAVGSLATEMIPGSYRIPNVRVETSVAYTNTPLAGAVRGFGSPQAHFALESLIDMLAKKISIDPLEIRRKNILKPGDRVFTGVTMDDSARALSLCVEEMRKAEQRLRQKPSPPGKKCGVGLALGAQTMGLGAKVPDDSSHRVEWLPDGSIALYVGTPDMGQGLTAVAEQMAAEALGLPYDKVKMLDLDTSVAPNGGTICASRMTYMTGNALLTAAQDLKARLLEEAARILKLPARELKYEHGAIIRPDGRHIPVAEFTSRLAEDGIKLKAEATFSFPYPPETTPQHLPIGMPHVKYCFGGQVVRVEVDPETGKVDVTDITAIHDVGKIINRTGVEGQIDGGVSMGLGLALLENMDLKESGAWVDSFAEYLMPTSGDMPPVIERIILEVPDASGPFGAKGIGEVTVVPTAPAIANAVDDAVGVRVTSTPISPEKVLGLSKKPAF